MKKIIILTIIITIAFVIAGCEEQGTKKSANVQPEIAKENPAECEKPYIQRGLECCLDNNSNEECDDTEITIAHISETGDNNYINNPIHFSGVEKCTIPSGIACIDFNARGTGRTIFELVLQNSAGFDMADATVNITGTGGSSTVSCTETDFGNDSGADGSFSDGVLQTVNVVCQGTSAGTFKGEIVIKYTNAQSGLQQTKTGELVVNIGK